MKALIATVALLVVGSIGSPATAQVTGDEWDNQALGAFAQVQMTPQQRRNLARTPSLDGRIHSPNPAFDVYDNQGRYVGSDPDMFIRNELGRDPPGRGDD
jgi:hypothetical protein